MQKHADKFSYAINSLNSNKNCDISLVPITSSEFFPSISKFHTELFKKIEEQTSVNVGDYWEIEFLLGSAKELAEQYGYVLPSMFTNYNSVSSRFSGIFFIMGADGFNYLVSEAVPLENVDIRDLLGDLIERDGYTTQQIPFNVSNVFWYRILPPQEKISSTMFQNKKTSKITNLSS